MSAVSIRIDKRVDQFENKQYLQLAGPFRKLLIDSEQRPLRTRTNQMSCNTSRSYFGVISVSQRE